MIVGILVENGATQIVDAIVSDSTGTTGTANTSVTVFSNGVTIPLTPVPWPLSNSSAVTFLGAPYITGQFFSNSPITYTAWQAYQFQISVGSATYSASITGIAANPVVQPSSGSAGVTCSWSNGVGNRSFAYVDSPSIKLYLGPVLSSNPYIIANSVFSDETPGAGNDAVNLNISQFSTAAFPEAQTSSYLITSNVASASY